MTDAPRAKQLHSEAMKLVSGGRLVESVPLLRQAVALDPRDPVFLHNYAHALQLIGEASESEVCFTRALSIAPDYADAHYNFGQLLYSKGQYVDAVGHLTRAVQLSPQNHRAYLGLGAALMEERRFIEASRNFETALALKPDYIEALISLGAAKAEMDERASALSAALDADRLAAKNIAPRTRYYLGVLLARVGVADRARVHLNAYLASDPNDPKGAGMILATLGQAPPDRAPAGLLDGIYARRAALWDQDEAYHGHVLAADAVRALVGAKQGLSILDAGCGTGLVGARLKPLSATLVGVDMSEAMLTKAHAKGIYAELYRDDLIAYMNAHPNVYDVIVSAATLIHFGDLTAAFKAAAVSLQNQGAFVLTLFPNERDTKPFIAHPMMELARSGCYAHHRDYVKNTARAAGLSVLSIEDKTHEDHDGGPVPGIVVSLRR